MKEEFNVPTRETALNDNEHFKEISTSCSEKQNTENKCKRNKEDATVKNVMTNEENNDCTSYGPYGTSLNMESEAEHVYDTRSIRSISTASTIAPDVIKKRTKLALDKRDRSKTKRALIKGEASAVTRIRRDNRATIKESTGIWGWE